MQYDNMIPGRFVKRENRFIAKIMIDDQEETVHVKNTGRCRELLLPGAEVALQPSANLARKTKYDLISVYKPSLGWVNIDSQVPNKVVLEYLMREGYENIHPEYTFGQSRLDFCAEKDGEKYLIEVKGCTLEIDGKGYFPDAPSLRAVKHIRELMGAKAQDRRAVIAFVIAMNQVTHVYPNDTTDPEFAQALTEAAKQGVEIWHLCCRVTRDTIEITQKHAGL